MKILLSVLLACIISTANAGGWLDILKKHGVDVSGESHVLQVQGMIKDGGAVLVSVKNTTNQPVGYIGYEQRFPQFYIANLKDDGTWDYARWAYCGTFLSRYSLEPGETIQWRANPRSEEKWGTIIRLGDEQEQLFWFYDGKKMTSHQQGAPGG